jgi:hypothetical protein
VSWVNNKKNLPIEKVVVCNAKILIICLKN